MFTPLLTHFIKWIILSSNRTELTCVWMQRFPEERKKKERLFYLPSCMFFLSYFFVFVSLFLAFFFFPLFCVFFFHVLFSWTVFFVLLSFFYEPEEWKWSHDQAPPPSEPPCYLNSSLICCSHKSFWSSFPKELLWFMVWNNSKNSSYILSLSIWNVSRKRVCGFISWRWKEENEAGLE